MKQTPMQELRPAGTTKYRNYVVWSILLSALLLAAVTMAYYASWGSVRLPGGPMLFWASVGTAVCIIGRRLQRHNTAAALLQFLPWPVLLLRTGLSAPARGAMFWANCQITRWNMLHDSGLPLFQADVSMADVEAFSLLIAMATAQLVWWLVAERKILLAGVWCFFWLTVMVVGGCYAPLPAALLLASVLCISMSAAHVRITMHTVLVSVLLTAGLALCALLPEGELARVKTLRENLQDGVYALRYGEKTLPEGNLYNAAQLQASDEEMLTVETQQEKSFYLRGYVGSVYADGVWTPLPGSAFAGDNAGMLQWLQAQGFDPLTQSAEYWQLDENTPEPNRMTVRVNGASRYYVYAPVSLADTTARDVNGEMLRSTGLLGWREYTCEEISDYRPAELMVASAWVTNPHNDDQRRYSEAEAVYRRFVYDNYTALDADTNAFMQQLFWDDYESDADGIYSAVSHLRTVLKRQVTYSETITDTPAGSDPVRYFLTGSRRGNSALYASATVLALRAKGIPARYVEGYCLPAAQVGSGTVTLTGHDAHAWAEAYFDGIGWLPLDTVPGYYYEAVALQQMVGAPDAVHKTAALQDNNSEAARITGDENGAGSPRPPLEIAKDAAVLLLGVLAVLLLALTVVFATAEITRGLRYRLAMRRYRRTKPVQRVAILEKYLYKILRVYGIQAALGWNTADMDKTLTGRFVDVEPGEYARVCSLIEKTVYGGEAPDLREERAMQGFLHKLVDSGREEPLHRRLQLRYSCP